MKDLTKYYIDLSKCTEEQQKHIISLLPKPITYWQYKILFAMKYLYYNKKMKLWIVTSIEIVYDKTELTYHEFIKLFEGEKEETDIYTREDIENAYRAGENEQTYYLKDTTVILPTTYEGVDG